MIPAIPLRFRADLRTALFAAIVLLTGAASRAESTPALPPIVIVLAGQSNMVGQGDLAQLAPAQRAWPANVELIVAGQAPSRQGGGSFGPELALAHELARAMPERNFKFLKFARGTTSIRVWAPQWSAEDAAVAENADVAPLYPRLLAFVREHLRAEDGPPHAILWFQGERDARFAAAAADYAPRLDDFIAQLRRDLAAPDAWFLAGVVNPPYAHAEAVAVAQRTLPQRVPRTASVSAEGLSKRRDNLHYDTAGQWELGRRYAEALLPTLRE